MFDLAYLINDYEETIFLLLIRVSHHDAHN